MKHFIHSLAFFALSPLCSALGQEEWGEGGKINDTEFVIVKEKELVLPPANRQFAPMRKAVDAKSDTTQAYAFKRYMFPMKPLTPNIEPKKTPRIPFESLTTNYIKGGLGNYMTAFLEAYTGSSHSKDRLWGAAGKYLHSFKGPVDGTNSGALDASANAFLKKFGTRANITGDLGYAFKNYRYYGYGKTDNPPKSKSIAQNYHVIDAEFTAQNARMEVPTEYKFFAHSYFLREKGKVMEQDNLIEFSTLFSLNQENTWFSIVGQGAFSNLIDTASSTGRHFGEVNPAYKMKKGNLSLHLGLKAAFDADTAASNNHVFVFPDMNVNLALAEGAHSVYAGLDGGMARKSLKSVLEENPFWDTRAKLAHTKNTGNVFVGAKGDIARKFAYKVNASYGLYRDMLFYGNSNTDSTKFIGLYDRAGLLNLHSELAFKHKGVRTIAKVDYYNYSLKTLAEAYHKPNFRASLLATFAFSGKANLNLDMYYMTGLKGLSPASGKAVALPQIADANLNFEYILSEKMSIFVMGNNIFGQKYQRFYNYQVKTVNVIAGLNYSF